MSGLSLLKLPSSSGSSDEKSKTLNFNTSVSNPFDKSASQSKPGGLGGLGGLGKGSSGIAAYAPSGSEIDTFLKSKMSSGAVTPVVSQAQQSQNFSDMENQKDDSFLIKDVRMEGVHFDLLVRNTKKEKQSESFNRENIL